MNNLFEDPVSQHLLNNGLYTIRLVDVSIIEKRRSDIKERMFKFDFIEDKSGKSVSRWMRATMDPAAKHGILSINYMEKILKNVKH